MNRYKTFEVAHERARLRKAEHTKQHDVHHRATSRRVRCAGLGREWHLSAVQNFGNNYVRNESKGRCNPFTSIFDVCKSSLLERCAMRASDSRIAHFASKRKQDC